MSGDDPITAAKASGWRIETGVKGAAPLPLAVPTLAQRIRQEEPRAPDQPAAKEAATPPDQEVKPVIPDEVIDRLEFADPGCTGTDDLTRIVKELEHLGAKFPSWLCEQPIEAVRAELKTAARSERVLETHHREQEVEARRQARGAYPEIPEYIEVPIQSSTTLRVTPYPGGYAVSVWNSNLKRQIHRSGHKAPPWRSDKIRADTGSAIATEMSRAGLGAEADLRDQVGKAWEALRALIQDNPSAELAIQSPVVKKALTNLTEVRIVKGETTISEAIYVVDGTQTSLEFDAKAYTGTAANLNERWYNAFAPDEINADKADWAQIKRFWGEIAEVVEVEEFNSWDAIAEQFRVYLQKLHIGKELRDLIVSGFCWFDTGGACLKEPRTGGAVWVPTSAIREFTEKELGGVHTPNALAKALKDREIMLEGTKPLQVRANGERKTGRGWPINPEFINYRPEWTDSGEVDPV
mgnify:CR=1 FL=1